jgi:hypothetical protein
MKQAAPAYIIPLCIFGFFLGFYLLTSRGTIGEADGIVNFLTIRAIVEEKSLAVSCQIIEEFVSLGRHNLCYSKYDIGLPLTALPLYLLANMITGTAAPANPDLISPHKLMVGMTNQISTAVTCALVYLLGLHFSGSKRVSVELAFLFGVATMAWPYAATFFSQPVSGMLLLLAAVLLIIPDTPKSSHLLAAGLASGWACLVRLDTLPLVGLIGLYALYKCKKNQSWRFALGRLAVFALPILLSLLLYLFSNWWRFGNISQSGYEGEGWSTPFLAGLYGLTLSPAKGIIFYSPLIILATFGLIRLGQRGFSAEVTLILALFITQLLIYSAWWAWEGGWVWGPRFLVPTLPFMIMGLLPWLECPSPRCRIPLLLILTFSFFIQIIGATTDSLVYLTRVGVDYQEVLSNPQYSPILGQLEDLLARRVALLVTTDAQGLFTRTQTVIWAFFCLGLMGISIIQLQNSLKNTEQPEFV